MPRPLGRKALVDFLVSQKYPPLTLATLVPGSRPVGPGLTTLGRIRTHEEVRQYQAELASLQLRNFTFCTSTPKANCWRQRSVRRRSVSSINRTPLPTSITGPRRSTGLLMKPLRSPWARRPKLSVGRGSGYTASPPL